MTERTFGLEIEMCNVDRKAVMLPDGFKWSEDESIFNTDATVNKRYGGEVNTPPLRFCRESLRELESLYTSMLEAGGKLKWSIDLHVHLYSGDLTLDQIKNVFFFLWHCYPYIKRYCRIADWDEKVFNAQPLVTERHYEAVRSSATFEALNNALSNQSNKRYIRFAINVASHFVRNTIEFRCFHATDRMDEVVTSIIASYRFLHYAMSHTEEDFKAIGSYEEWLRTLRLEARQNTPRQMHPLVYMGNPLDPKQCFMTTRLSFNARYAKCLDDLGLDELAIVGGDMSFSYELAMWRKRRISVWTQDKVCGLIHAVVKGTADVEFKEKLQWVQMFNSDDTVRKVALILYATQIKKYADANTIYGQTLLDAFKAKAQESIEKIEKSASELVEMLQSVEFHFGDVRDAIATERNVFFQFGTSKKTNGIWRFLKSNIETGFDCVPKATDYYGLVESVPEGCRFIMFSESPYLTNLVKLSFLKYASAKNEGRYLYGNFEPEKTEAFRERQDIEDFAVKIPPADIDIGEPEKLRICRITGAQLLCLQKRFIKKVDKISMSRFCFAVMYGDCCLGGFGFDFPRAKIADLWQLSDFCTNNDVPRLSKFILYCVRSSLVQKTLSRSIGRLVEDVYTCVYTKNPCSMKYRGEYKKDDSKSEYGKLVYITTLGKYGSEAEIIEKYRKQISK